MLNAVIDISHHNTVSSFEQAKNSGVYGVIHKATQGVSYVDPALSANRKGIEAQALLFGAYHFGVAGEAVMQAEHFVDTVGPDALLVLDFESNPQGNSMSLQEAEQFVERVQQLAGRYPGLYSGHVIKESLAHAGALKAGDTVLSQCWLWIAQYGNAPQIPELWSRWTLWQYTDGSTGPEPHAVAGIGSCDRDKFNGTAGQLQDFWLKHKI